MGARWRRLLQHAEWANRAVLGAVEEAGTDSVRLFAHVLAAEVIWLARLEGREWHTTPIWPEWGLAECRARSKEVQRGQIALITRQGGGEPVNTDLITLAREETS